MRSHLRIFWASMLPLAAGLAFGIQLVAQTDRVLPLAKKDGWTVVVMETDWKEIIPDSGK